MNQISIMKIVERHLPQMLLIWNAHYKVLTTSEKIHTLDSLTEWFRTKSDGNHEYFGLFSGEELNAFMILKYDPDALRLKMLAVAKKQQNKGYGTKLLNFAQLERKSNPFICEVKVENIDALNFFYTQGFQIIEFLPQVNEYILKFCDAGDIKNTKSIRNKN